MEFNSIVCYKRWDDISCNVPFQGTLEILRGGHRYNIKLTMRAEKSLIKSQINIPSGQKGTWKNKTKPRKEVEGSLLWE